MRISRQCFESKTGMAGASSDPLFGLGIGYPGGSGKFFTIYTSPDHSNRSVSLLAEGKPFARSISRHNEELTLRGGAP